MTRIYKLSFLALFFYSCGPDHQALFDSIDLEIQQDSLNRSMFFAFQTQSFCINNEIVIPESEKVDSFYSILKSRKSKMETIKLTKLDPVSNVKYKLINVSLKKALEGIEIQKTHLKNPRAYNPLPFLEYLIQKKDAQIILDGLKEVGDLLKTGINNLSQTDSNKMEAALNDIILSYEFLDTEILDHISAISENQPALLSALEETKLVVKDFIGFCNSLILEKENADLFSE